MSGSRQTKRINEPSRQTFSNDILMERVKGSLGIYESAEDDFESLRNRTMPGSCGWLLQRKSFQNWLENSVDSPGLLWLTGNPGSGKSTLASFAISEIRKRNVGSCHFHFFLATHHGKRTLSYLLRSLALQIALSRQDFCARLLSLQENTGINIGNQKATIIWEKIFEGIFFDLPSSKPIFWVFDGLDEAEGPSELIRLLSKPKPAARINVLLVSRSTKELARDFNDYFLPEVVHDVISVDDTEADISGYVGASIHKTIPGEYAEDVIKDILGKASGSFLWVRLVLGEIRDNCYTREDIKTALSEIPEGMGSLYERMAESIARQPPNSRKIASRVLNWAACAFRPLEIAELEVALKPDFNGFVNLEQAIVDVCGNFVVINRSKVAPIHQTAHQFLLQKVSNSDLGIGESKGHMRAAIVCLDFLSDSAKWKRVFSAIQDQKPSRDHAIFEQYPFLSYSLSFWAYHVSLADASSDDLLEAVLMFFQTHCLVWMHGVALSGSLRILIQTTQYIKTYMERRATKAFHGPPTRYALTRNEELQQWANNLIRIVGRFGTNLIASPSSIHKYVVPFCPRDSIFGVTFRCMKQSDFAVSGISSTTWDDCLARLTTGEDQAALGLLSKDNFFITLVGINGTLIVWEAETCEEVRRIVHGEYVMHMASSQTSSLIATAGFKTTKIWDVTTGKELHCLPKDGHHHTKAIAFKEGDSEVIVAYDDCVVECLDMKSGQKKWRFLASEPEIDMYNCARYIAFSPDISQIAIVFRGRPVAVWTLPWSTNSVQIPPKRCSIPRGDGMRLLGENDVRNSPEMALWHPTMDHLVILYEDTKVVDWDVIEDEQIQHSHLNAREMVLSPDGELLLTSNANGTLSLWMLPEYRLTYRLQYDELVYGLAFSPDGTRFYDIRGTFCNVWEPNMLFRTTATDREEEESSASGTITTEPVISKDDNTRPRISSLVCDSSGNFYCCGKEDGSVTIHDIPDGSKVRKVTSHDSSVSVIKLAWSTSRRYIVSADDSGRIVAKRLRPPSKETIKWAVFPMFEIRVDEAVKELLFNSDEQFLLIACADSAQVMKLRSKEKFCHIDSLSMTGAVYLNHPNDPSVFLSVDSTREQAIPWNSLSNFQRDETISKAPPALDPTSDSSNLNRIISRAVQVLDDWLVQETVPATGYVHAGSENRHIQLIDLRQLPKGASSAVGAARQGINKLAKHVRRLIGCYQDHVVFVDHQLWVCTWQIQAVYKMHRRQFFLPKDWLNPDTLTLIVLTNQGTLLCPKNGEVGIVRSGLKFLKHAIKNLCTIFIHPIVK